MLGGGLGVRLLAAAAPAPPGRSPLPLSSSSSLRRRSSSWWLANTGNACERDGTTATTSSRAARRRWWSDPDANQQDYGYYGSSSLEEEEEEEGDDYGDEDEPAFPGLGGAGELFDEPWFSRVYRRYGFLLPVVLVSMFAATGPKAFLMAMAIPLGQSAVSFLLDAVWGRRRSNRDGSWRRPFQDEEEEDYPEDTDFGAASRGKGYSSSSYEGRTRDSYQSWVSNDFAGTASAAGGTDDNSAKSSSSGDGGGSKSGGGFGGWDEILDNNVAAAQDATRSRSSVSAGKADYSKRSRPSTAWEGDADATASSGGRMGQGVGVPQTRMRTRRQRTPRTMGLGTTRYKQAPLLMRLLVAVFPFLGSWFRLL
ncbi:hypothetical protein U9M48_018112 [Paspalum notatum var. saurae]|uniref:Uncharacterized protein n=1 Tax=Paspalum notatum var. saurae TaxID=547442 RepID=A0AAQ3WQ82_PASNO